MLRNLIPKTEFSKNVLTLMTGNSIAQLIQIAFIPVLTRLYSPADFGVFAVYLSISTIISAVAAFRYEFAIMLPKEDQEAANVLILSSILSLSVSLISFIGLLIFMPLIKEHIENKHIIKWLYFVPVTVLFSSMYQIFNIWSNRNTRYRIMTASIVSQRSGITATNLIMGLAKIGEAGLVLGNILGQLVSAMILLTKSISKDKNKMLQASFNGMRKVVIRYKKFPLFDSVNTLFFNFSTKGIVILISKFFGDIVVGFYSLAERLMITPFNFFIDAFSQAFYQKLAYTFNHNRNYFNTLIEQAIQRIAVIITIPYLILVATSKWYIPVILGNQWDMLYKYIHIFSPFVYISLTASPYTHTLKIIDKQNVALYMNLITFIIKFLTIIISGYVLHLNIIITIIYFSAVSFLASLAAIIIINQYLKIKFSVYFGLVSLTAFICYLLFFFIYA
jgi:O-antigen/teichoic acid export membrane protein